MKEQSRWELMEHKNILIVVENLIKEHHFHCDWGIEWSEKQHFMELIFQFNLENPDKFLLTDVMNNQFEDKTVPFETKIVFYDDQYMRAEMKHYLKSIPVNQRVGIMYGDLISVIKYLKILTSEVPLKWREFIQNPRLTEFKLEWQDASFVQLRETLLKTSRFSESAVFFPKNNP